MFFSILNPINLTQIYWLMMRVPTSLQLIINLSKIISNNQHIIPFNENNNNETKTWPPNMLSPKTFNLCLLLLDCCFFFFTTHTSIKQVQKRKTKNQTQITHLAYLKIKDQTQFEAATWLYMMTWASLLMWKRMGGCWMDESNSDFSYRSSFKQTINQSETINLYFCDAQKNWRKARQD